MSVAGWAGVTVRSVRPSTLSCSSGASRLWHARVSLSFFFFGFFALYVVPHARLLVDCVFFLLPSGCARVRVLDRCCSFGGCSRRPVTCTDGGGLQGGDGGGGDALCTVTDCTGVYFLLFTECVLVTVQSARRIFLQTLEFCVPVDRARRGGDRVLMRVQTDPIKVNGVASAARRCSIAAVRLDQRVGLSTIEGDLK